MHGQAEMLCRGPAAERDDTPVRLTDAYMPITGFSHLYKQWVATWKNKT